MAFLVLHEALYFLAKELAHIDSSLIRPFVSLLLNKEFMDSIQSPAGKQELFMVAAQLDLSRLPSVFVEAYRTTLQTRSEDKWTKIRMFEALDSYKRKVEKLNLERFRERTRDLELNRKTETQVDERYLWEFHNLILPEFFAETSQTEGEAFFAIIGPLVHRGIIESPEIFTAATVDHAVARSRACHAIREDAHQWENLVELAKAKAASPVLVQSAKAKLALHQKVLRFCGEESREP